jgi:hypothetical protein
MGTFNLYIILWLFCYFLKEGFHGQIIVTYTERFNAILFITRQSRYEHRTSVRAMKGRDL